MLTIPGFSLTEQIYSSTNTCIYRGSRDRRSVIVKALKDEYPSIEAIARIKHEYSIVCNLKHHSIVTAISLDTSDKRLVLVFEDFGGISLKQYLQSTKPSVDLALEIAISITQALIYIHELNLIHKDIKPANIIINPDTREVKLTDFSIASRLSKEIIKNNPNQIEGTLAYMSPEQTGRMNRTLDYRTDFYSLGVTLYEMLTSFLPFQSNDVMEVVHSHIANTSTPVRELNPDVPQVLADIVDKLMAKNAEDRYQSAKGLLADLEQLASGNTIFTPGEMDLRSQLLIPQKLYGREEQVTSLLEVFEKVAQGRSQLVLVSGYSGIGKTSVINEINKPITARKGYFISGKFDQFKRDIPYASLIEAFSELIQQLLTENLVKIGIWKQKIKNAVGNNGQVLIDLIPELELIIGQQPPVSELPPTEAQNRFNRILIEFIKVFCQAEHPLAIFLDDLQWADSATLKLMQLLVTDTDIYHLMLIGAYRDNEVSPTHRLITTLEEIDKAGTKLINLILQPLDAENVGKLLRDTLCDNHNESHELAQLIFHKTGGNPFFITQLLQTLYQESLLKFDFRLRSWQWNLGEIQAIGITDKSVVELVASRLEKLPGSTQDILKLAACIGDKFSLDILSMVSQKNVFETATELDIALQAGFILPLNEAYRIPLLFQEQESVFDSQKIGYKFLHDRVQQAAYSLIPDSNKQATHLDIGNKIRTLISPEKVYDNILDIVNQLNFGVDLLSSQIEKDDLAELNLMAAKKAKNNAAYQTSQKYLNIGLALIDKKSWEKNYKLTLSLYTELAESLYINSNFEQSQKIADIALSKANSVLDKVKIYEIKIRSLISQNKMLEATEKGIEILDILGVKLPKNPTIIHVIKAVLQTKLTLQGRKIEDLAYLTSMVDMYKLAAMQILALIDSAASMAGTLHFPLTTLLMVRLSVLHGNSAFSSYAYAVYGAILCDKFGDIKLGYKFGELSLYLVDKFNTVSLKCKIVEIVNCLILHFQDHIISTTKTLDDNVLVGLETGDIQFSLYSAWGSIYHQLMAGKSLSFISSQIDKYLILGETLQIKSVITSINIAGQMISDLSNQDFQIKDIMSREVFNEQKMLDAMQNNLTFISTLPFCKIIINYLFEEYEEVVNNALLSEVYHQKTPGFFFYNVNTFYHSLALLAQYPKRTLKERKQHLKQVAANQNKMKKWAHHAPCNYQHKYDLVEAEKARILGKNTIAADLYDKARSGAKTNNYTQEVALANELAGKFYLEIGKENIAKVYMTDAYYAYIEWGAYAKVNDLEKKYPQLIIRNTVQTNDKIDISSTINSSFSTEFKSISNNSSILDIATIIKTSETIQSDVNLESLPRTLLHIIIENAGAQKGCLIVEKNGFLFIEAIDTGNKNDEILLQEVPVEQSPDISLKVINYVQRTKQTLVIKDAQTNTITKLDPYIQSTKAKSILCVPIIYQTKQIGLIYLENNLITGAFTVNQLELIKVLASQAAIALKNARLLLQEQQKNIQLQEILEQLEITQGQLVEKNTDLESALAKLQNAQSQLVHTEKISALGQLVAGVAHEVNNPVSFISGNLTHANQYVEDLVHILDMYQKEFPNPSEELLEEIEAADLEYLLEDLPKMLNSMEVGTVRIKDIMQSLRNFSRNDGDQKRTVNIHEGIDSTILILGHRLKASPERPAIKIIKEYGELPQVECYPGQLNQVFMNLCANAIDAMEEANQGKTYQEIEKNPNSITIRTLKESDRVQISIKDNGAGMSEETREKLFAAFFTTKPEGKGTGLGLSISYQIVTEKHGGTLDCISQPGEGAEFVISIPFS